jgi:hypothetical protein
MWEAIKFLWENRDVFEAVERAVKAGITKEDIVKSVDRVIVEASDVALEKEIGTP